MRAERLILSVFASKKLCGRRTVNRSETRTTLILDRWKEIPTGFPSNRPALCESPALRYCPPTHALQNAKPFAKRRAVSTKNSFHSPENFSPEKSGNGNSHALKWAINEWGKFLKQNRLN